MSTPWMSTSNDISNNVKVPANHFFTRQNKNNNWLRIDYCQLKQLEEDILPLISLWCAWNSQWLVEITLALFEPFQKDLINLKRMMRSLDVLHSRPLLKVGMVLSMHWSMPEQRELWKVFHITSAHKGSLGLWWSNYLHWMATYIWGLDKEWPEWCLYLISQRDQPMFCG